MPRVTPFLLLLLMLLFQTCLCQARDDGVELGHVVLKMHVRKLLVGTTQDYDFGGSNPKHDPKKGKPGGGGKNP